MLVIKKVLAMKQEKNHLYLLEFGPNIEQVLEQISVQEKLEKIIEEYAVASGLEVDSCDILFDYIAITFYLHTSADVDSVIIALKKHTNDELLKQIPEFKKFVMNDSLWEHGYNIEIL